MSDRARRRASSSPATWPRPRSTCGRPTRTSLAVEAPSARRRAAPRAVRELFRSLHTIKGLSAMVGVDRSSTSPTRWRRMPARRRPRRRQPARPRCSSCCSRGAGDRGARRAPRAPRSCRRLPQRRRCCSRRCSAGPRRPASAAATEPSSPSSSSPPKLLAAVEHGEAAPARRSSGAAGRCASTSSPRPSARPRAATSPRCASGSAQLGEIVKVIPRVPTTRGSRRARLRAAARHRRSADDAALARGRRPPPGDVQSNPTPQVPRAPTARAADAARATTSLDGP